MTFKISPTLQILNDISSRSRYHIAVSKFSSDHEVNYVMLATNATVQYPLPFPGIHSLELPRVPQHEKAVPSKMGKGALRESHELKV